MRKAAWVLWPSFIAAAAGAMFFFSMFDPADLELGRPAAYTMAFFFFWSLAAGSSWLTCLLQRREEPGATP